MCIEAGGDTVGAGIGDDEGLLPKREANGLLSRDVEDELDDAGMRFGLRLGRGGRGGLRTPDARGGRGREEVCEGRENVG